MSKEKNAPAPRIIARCANVVGFDIRPEHMSRIDKTGVQFQLKPHANHPGLFIRDERKLVVETMRLLEEVKVVTNEISAEEIAKRRNKCPKALLIHFNKPARVVSQKDPRTNHINVVLQDPDADLTPTEMLTCVESKTNTRSEILIDGIPSRTWRWRKSYTEEQTGLVFSVILTLSSDKFPLRILVRRPRLGTDLIDEARYVMTSIRRKTTATFQQIGELTAVEGEVIFDLNPPLVEEERSEGELVIA